MEQYSNIIDCLEDRGFIEAITSEDVRKICEKPIRVYGGFDPTADSLHLGNLMGIMTLAWFQKFGHTPVVILGGATGRIGDPSGKSHERPLLDSSTIQKNVQRIHKHFEQILDFTKNETKPLLLNNDQWFSKIGVIDFLRDIGKHFRIGPMLSKESIRSRFDSEEGISYTEFSYLLLQAYDFYHLFQKENVLMQVGGSDQWGNITAGIELIRKLLGKTAYGLTHSLLVRSDGKKFGKSEEGAIWLAPDRCSPYQFYQYLVRVADADVITLMKRLTFMSMKTIREMEAKMQQKDYIPNTAQKLLAEEVTRIVHGEEGLCTALKVTLGAAPGKETPLEASVLNEIADDMPNVSLSQNEVLGAHFADLAVKSGLSTSKGEANRLIKSGGAYLNNIRVEDPQMSIQKEDLIEGHFLVIGSGKKKKILIRIESNS